jgi:hypothetical protein
MSPGGPFPVIEPISGTTSSRDTAPGLVREPTSGSRHDQGRDVTRQPPDLDLEAILAAAAQRLVKLGKVEAAAALASSSITTIRGFNDWSTTEVFISSPGDAFDVLTQDDLYLHEMQMGDFVEEYPIWGTSLMARVFTQVLPARMSCQDVEVKIAARPVAANWRDEYKDLLAQPSTIATGGDAASDQLATSRKPGRPAWTAELFHARYREALDRTDPPHKNASIAANLEMLDGEMGTDADYLRKLVQRFGLPPA